MWMRYWVAKKRKLFTGLWNAKKDDKREGNRDQIIKRFLIHVKEVRYYPIGTRELLKV